MSTAPRRILISGFVIAALAALALPAAAAATPAWEIRSDSNTTVAPGGTIDFMVSPQNVGDEPIIGFEHSFKLTMFLPTGLTGVKGTNEGNCTPIAGATTVECEFEFYVAPWTNNTVRFTAEADEQLAPGAILSTHFEVSGGEAPAPATTTDFVRVSAEDPPFGIDSLDVQAYDASGQAFVRAAGRPSEYGVHFNLNSHTNPETPHGQMQPVEPVRDVVTELPPGFLANVAHVQRCTLTELTHFDPEGTPLPECPAESQVGVFMVRFSGPFNYSAQPTSLGPVPIFNMAPPPGSAARFAFQVARTVIVLETHIRSEGDYGPTVTAPNVPEALPIIGNDLRFWGVPADESHFHERACPGQVVFFVGGPNCLYNGDELGFFRMPTSCTAAGEGLETTMRVDSWETPGDFKQSSLFSHAAPGFPAAPEDWGEDVGLQGCDEVPFDPSFSVLPSTGLPDSPTGLSVDLSLPQNCWDADEIESICQSDLRTSKVKLPQGMSVNPSAADGLSACSSAHIGLNTALGATPIHFNENPATCPDSSKIGSVEIETPLLDHSLKGDVYIGAQGDNPFKSLLAFYLVVEDFQSGVILKLPGRVVANEQTGQLETTFDENPQLPFSNLHLELFGGPRAALRTPPNCGTYTTQAELTPWARPDEPVSKSSSFQITKCPESGFDPKLSAGTENPLAGQTSPFSLRLTREDGEEELGGINATLPPGLTGYLRGIPYCPDAALAAVSGDEGTGAAQEAAPSCPAASQLGTVTVGAGAGANPFYTTAGKAYLAGPYKGAPLSIAVIAPAVAGPFDLGSVVVRNALRVDPETAQITAVSDPLPTILHGIPLDLRDVRVQLDRPGFTLNPTSCEPMAFDTLITSTQGATATPSERFQVAGCGDLGFKPGLALKLKGKTNRGAHPALSAVLKARPGDANIGRLAVTLPKTELLENAHIRTTCTRVQFAAGGGGGEQCPAGSVYGQVKATSPLLDYALEGPVFLRSSSHKLPDLVAVVKGPSTQPLIIAAVGRIDTVKGRIRTSFETFPDTPISKVVLKMQGGKKGLLVNERELCRAKPRASIEFDGQNGDIRDLRPLVKAGCGAARKGKRGHRRGGR